MKIESGIIMQKLNAEQKVRRNALTVSYGGKSKMFLGFCYYLGVFLSGLGFRSRNKGVFGEFFGLVGNFFGCGGFLAMRGLTPEQSTRIFEHNTCF